MFKNISNSCSVTARLTVVLGALLIAGACGCSQERYGDSEWDEGCRLHLRLQAQPIPVPHCPQCQAEQLCQQVEAQRYRLAAERLFPADVEPHYLKLSGR